MKDFKNSTEKSKMLLERLHIRGDAASKPTSFQKRIKMINYLLMIFIAIAFLMLISLFLVPIEEIYYAEGIVRPKEYFNIVASVDLVQEEKPLVVTGQKVKKGQVLMHFSLPELELSILETKQEIEEAKGQLELQRARMSALKKLPLPKELWEIKEQLQKAEQQKEYFKKQYERASKLHSTGDVSQQEVDRAKLDYDSAEIEFQRLRQRFNIIEQGYSENIIDEAKAQVKKTESRIAVLKEKLKHLENSHASLSIIRAPQDGKILELYNINTIGTIKKGEKLVFMSVGEEKIIEIFGLQQNFDKVRIGQKVRYKSKVYDNLKYDYAEGHVYKISQIREPDVMGVTGGRHERDLYYSIYASIDKQPKELSMDSNVTAQVILRKDLLFKILFDL